MSDCSCNMYCIWQAQQTTAITTVKPVSQSRIKMCMFSLLFGFYLNSFQKLFALVQKKILDVNESDFDVCVAFVPFLS